MIKWGRAGVVAAAFAVTFVTPVTSDATTIHKADLQPSHTQVVRHVTPATAAGAKTLHRASIRPSWKFETRHVTPSEVSIEKPAFGSGGLYGKPSRLLAQTKDEDEEIMIMITAFMDTIR